MPDDAPSDRPLNRRGFFRHGLRELLNSVTKAAEPLARALEPFARHGPPQAASLNLGRGLPVSLSNLVLRPPGALGESDFKETCSRCGRCVEVCPAQCIKIDSTGTKGDGVPYIDADTIPCVVCESLACMNTCPSGALAPTPMYEIDMGTAVWREELCIRSKGEECRICFEKCPLGTAAIDIIGPAVVVNPLGCIGCGICQHYCPTSPKAIVVIPVSAKA